MPLEILPFLFNVLSVKKELLFVYSFLGSAKTGPVIIVFSEINFLTSSFLLISGVTFVSLTEFTDVSSGVSS